MNKGTIGHGGALGEAGLVGLGKTRRVRGGSEHSFVLVSHGFRVNQDAAARWEFSACCAAYG